MWMQFIENLKTLSPAHQWIHCKQVKHEKKKKKKPLGFLDFKMQAFSSFQQPLNENVKGKLGG